jgi:predicted nuclease of predicted toxin-antitoxin system
MNYLVDVNLPKSFSSIKLISCVFVTDISDEMPDSEIWDFALVHNYIILSRDKDFYYRAMQSSIFPRIVLFRLGNSRAGDLTEYFRRNLAVIEQHLVNHRLLVLWPNEIQIVV